jgi:mycothiol synthase
MQFDLPGGYRLRPYRGTADLAAMRAPLIEYRARAGDSEMPTLEQMELTYANLVNCEPADDVALIEAGELTAPAVAGYVRTFWVDRPDMRVIDLFAPIGDEHFSPALLSAALTGLEAHTRKWIEPDRPAAYSAEARHPGHGRRPTVDGEFADAAVLESLGYTAAHFGAQLVRPHLDDIPERPLPPGVEVRPVEPDQLRAIFDAHWEAFRHEWDFREATEEDFAVFRDDPLQDTSLWKIAWSGDVVVGQVKTYVNADENAARGYRRGYTENISTHADWRNRGIAGALLAMSLAELRSRGFGEAALGVDTDNPGGAFHVYTSLGFELDTFHATYTKPAAFAR